MVKREKGLRVTTQGSRVELTLPDLLVFFVRGAPVAYENPTGIYINELLYNRDPITRRQVNIWRDFNKHKYLPPDIFVTGLAVLLRQATTVFEHTLSNKAYGPRE